MAFFAFNARSTMMQETETNERNTIAHEQAKCVWAYEGTSLAIWAGLLDDLFPEAEDRACVGGLTSGVFWLIAFILMSRDWFPGMANCLFFAGSVGFARVMLRVMVCTNPVRTRASEIRGHMPGSLRLCSQ
mmetsp:Transcript_13925/g.25689  ORF Transcript_13925/g.25689 Transcript_13925/m.25689 type:complete len:131 (-) Transcript_13925:48-440(-)